jgi:hypothetical protein
VYKDGTVITVDPSHYGFFAGKENFYIGGVNGNNFFYGSLDEIRVSRVQRSADWIKLCYENQKRDQVVCTF